MSLPRMSWHIGDYKKDTGHLRAAGHGAYFMLIMHYWATGGLPEDDLQLAAIACMTDKEWRLAKPTMQAFFHDGWKHKRVDTEIAEAQEKYEKRATAGGKGGKAPRKGKQNGSNAGALLEQTDLNAPAKAEQPITLTEKESKSSEAIASGAEAPRDYRADLFGRGLKALAEMTGKTPDSCRSTVGKWLKLVNDEAIHVLAAIDDCQQNRYANPVGWIFAALQAHGASNGRQQHQPPQPEGIVQAGRRRLAELAEFARIGDDPAGPDQLGEGQAGDPAGNHHVRLLSSR